jgi:hypothetical protein
MVGRVTDEADRAAALRRIQEVLDEVAVLHATPAFLAAATAFAEAFEATTGSEEHERAVGRMGDAAEVMTATDRELFARWQPAYVRRVRREAEAQFNYAGAAHRGLLRKSIPAHR